MFAWLAKWRRRPDPPQPAAAVPKAQFDQLNDRYRELRARYDAAQTNDDNRRHWANADGFSAASANSAHVRRVLRNRSRYEYDNGAYCNGIIRTRADDLVGAGGPRLQLAGPDEALNELVEALFSSWAVAAHFAEKLHTMDQTRCRDGEAFALFVTNPRVAHPVKLDLSLVEADRIADPYGVEWPQEGKLDGIEYDQLGQPIAYHVLDQHPGDLLTLYPMAATRIHAQFVLHWYRVDRPGQLRGVPELTSSLPLFPYQRRWTLATLAAAEYAASQAGVLETDGPLDPNTTTASPFQPVEFDRGVFTELPAGVKLKQLTAEHPNQQYAGFKREICNETGRPVRMPSNVVSADSSQHNFSSAKLDHYGYRGALGVDRYFAGVNHLDKILGELLREAQAVGVLPAGVNVAAVLALPRAWFWPGWPSMDKDQAIQDSTRLLDGTLTLSDYWAEQGEDWKAKIRQRGRELRYMESQGVPVIPEKPKLPPEPPPPDPEAPTNGKPQPPAAKAAHRLNGHLNGASGRA
jgi:capsid protein